MRKYDYTKIKTMDQAYAKFPEKVDLEKLMKALKSVPARLRRGMLATLNAQVLTEVINNNDPKVPAFKPDYNNNNQYKWFPWCIGGDSTGSGFRFGGSHFVWTLTPASGGARFALRDKARVEHVKKYFPDVYKELYLMLE